LSGNEEEVQRLLGKGVGEYIIIDARSFWSDNWSSFLKKSEIED